MRLLPPRNPLKRDAASVPTGARTIPTLLKSLGAMTAPLRAMGPGSVSSVLKVALDVAYILLWLITGVLLLLLIAAVFIPLDNVNITVTGDEGGRQLPLTRTLLLFGLGAATAYFGGFMLILRSLRRIFRTLTMGDPFHPANVLRLRQIGLILAVVTGGVWLAQGVVAARLAPGVMDPQGLGELLTPIFSVLIVFVLAEVFREGARLRRESELTI
ncbi:DUF2975 domain-containing protein [Brevundimonas sp. SL130]|uniref:DUF2975 domain-containing protein n=1 Tax=Brevundimonas sp. SL130 TaxID=2995143 RepID=UPI00226CC78F|nr:DUF2975 domain-containing protein [Brevundimonas sp. SL130]WAC60232.1 DUF2975 domain-containing protein [Brevundimonas sp. SL130]